MLRDPTKKGVPIDLAHPRIVRARHADLAQFTPADERQLALHPRSRRIAGPEPPRGPAKYEGCVLVVSPSEINGASLWVASGFDTTEVRLERKLILDAARTKLKMVLSPLNLEFHLSSIIASVFEGILVPFDKRSVYSSCDAIQRHDMGLIDSLTWRDRVRKIPRVHLVGMLGGLMPRIRRSIDYSKSATVPRHRTSNAKGYKRKIRHEMLVTKRTGAKWIPFEQRKQRHAHLEDEKG